MDRFLDQRCGGGFIQPPALEAGQAGLIAGGDGNVGAGAEIVQMHLTNALGRFQQYLGRPQRIVQITATLFQFGGQRAINHQCRVIA